MRLIGHLIVRPISIGFGFVLAVIAAALFLSLGLVRDVIGPAVEYHTGVAADGMLVPMVGLVTSPFLAASVLAPAAICIAIAELMAWRGWLPNIAAGGVIALFAGWRELAPNAGEALDQGLIIVLLAAGFIAGAVYWIVAGRGAGKWLK